MRRTLLALALGCLLTAAHAHAAGGVALRWNHCYGEGTGLSTRAFACDTNSGFEELIGSFAIAEDMVNVSGNEIVVDISTASPYAYMPVPPSGPPLPEWWKFRNAGTCRQNALSVAFVADPGNVVCQDWGQGGQVGGIGAYNIDFRGPGTARILIAEAVPMSALQSLSAGTEYYSFTLRIAHIKTVGTGACGGCGTPLYISINSIYVTTDTPDNDRLYSGPLNGADSNFALWNGLPVPVRASSWGALKSRYR